jgi:hypothetical protein
VWLLTLLAMIVMACQPQPTPTATPQPAPTETSVPATSTPFPTLTPLPTIPRITDPSSLDPSLRASVRLLVAVPDAPAVDVYAGASPIAVRLGFGRLTVPQPLAPTEHLIRVGPTGNAGATPLFEEPFTFAEGQASILAFVGTAAGFVSQRIDEDLASLPAGFARMSVYYLAPDAASAVPIEVSFGSALEETLTNSGDAIKNVPLLADTYNLRIKRGDQEIRQSVSLQAHRNYIYLLVWQSESKLQLIRNTTPTIRESRLRVVHANTELPAYDVYLNDALTAEALAFRASSEWQITSARNYDVSLRPAGAAADSPPLLRRQFTLNPETALNLAIVHRSDSQGEGSGEPTPDIVLFAEDISPTLPGQARISFAHVARTEADVYVTEAGGTYQNMPALRTRSISAPLAVAPASVRLAFLTRNGERETTIEAPTPFEMKAGFAYLYLVSGNQRDSIPTVLATDVGSSDAPRFTPTPVPDTIMRVRLINGLATAQAVDLYIGDTLFAEKVAQATGSDYLPVVSTDRTLRLALAGSTQMLAEWQLQYQPRRVATYLAFGTADAPRLIELADSARPTATDTVLRVIHAVPNGPRVSVFASLLVGVRTTPTLEELFQAISYGQGSEGKSMRDGRYVLIFQSAEDRTEIARLDSVELRPKLRYDVLILPPADGSSSPSARVVVITNER